MMKIRNRASAKKTGVRRHSKIKNSNLVTQDMLFNTGIKVPLYGRTSINVPSYRSSKIVWARAAEIASSLLDDVYFYTVEKKLNSFRNGTAKDFDKIYAIRLTPNYRAIFQKTSTGYKVLDIVNRFNYDPNKVVEIS